MVEKETLSHYKRKMSNINTLLEEKSKEIEQIIRQKNKLKEKISSIMKDCSVSQMSHKIRTPLNSIIGFTDLLIQSELNDKETDKEYLKNIQTSAQELYLTLKTLLNKAKLLDSICDFD